MADGEFLDGFDKYGPVNYTASLFQALMTANKWTQFSFSAGAGQNPIASLVASLFGSGAALNLNNAGSNNSSVNVSKTLAASYKTVIGICWVQPNVGSGWGTGGIFYTDGGSNQIGWTITATGQFQVIVGSTVIATGSGPNSVISFGTNHVIEWKFSVDPSAGIAEMWVDGSQIVNFSGNTRATSNSTFNGVEAYCNGGLHNLTFDHFWERHYLSTTTDAPVLDNSTIQTDWPSADSVVQFTPTAGVLGFDYSVTGATNAPGANTLYLRKFTPPVNCTLNSVSMLPQTTSAGANFKAVAYSDSAGAPNTLLSSGNQVTGCTAGTLLTGNLVTPQSLTGGTAYWVGFITDTSIAISEVDTGTSGQKVGNTYASGAPATAPTMTANQPDWLVFGNLSGMAANYSQVDTNPPYGALSHNDSNTAGQSDLFTYPNLPGTTATVHTGCISVYGSLSTTGARTLSNIMKSGSTVGQGSNPGYTSSLSFGWSESYFDNDPNTSAAWTPTNYNAAKVGYEIVT